MLYIDTKCVILMREARLQSVWKKQLVNTTDSKYDLRVAENLLNCQFNPIASDFTVHSHRE
ncbi:hypothetical protein NTGM5_10095 [Candidatus Nitrotoga sp. M5]|nr:hypothetical protein NTGM5_10095 [Candidatus Nitrotoga sp. M5]